MTSLIARVRQACRVRHFSLRIEEAYAGWIRRYIAFHKFQHPATLREDAVAAFLSSLATTRHVAAATQNQALAALLFPYDAVLDRPLAAVHGIVRARQPERLPVVLSKDEVRAVLGALRGTARRIATRLYGDGLRLLDGDNKPVWPTPHERIAAQDVATVADARKEASAEFLHLAIRQGRGPALRSGMVPVPVHDTKTHSGHDRHTF